MGGPLPFLAARERGLTGPAQGGLYVARSPPPPGYRYVATSDTLFVYINILCVPLFLVRCSN